MTLRNGYRRNRHDGLRLLFASLVCGLSFASHAYSGQPEAKPETAPQATAAALLAPEKMREDLDYTVQILRNVHPATCDGFSSEQQAAIDAAYGQIQEPRTANTFYFVINSVICSLQDGHTNLRPRGDNQNRRIDVPIVWLHDGSFYVEEDREPFRQGDRIVALGGKSIEAIYQRMRAVIPAENEHYRKMRMAVLIQREEFLDYLGVIEKDAVDMGVERAGNRVTLNAPLKSPAPYAAGQPARPWVGYEIDADLSLGVFYLDSCLLNDQYRNTVKAFFTEVSEKSIRNIAVDVRRNGGGNSSVIDEFLRYFKIDRYRHYSGDVRYSKEVAPKTGYIRTWGYERGKPRETWNDRVKDPKLLFDGKLFVLTSTCTFSSGNWFAVLVKDNSLGTVLGEPTGNAPSSYGDVPSFQLPDTGFWFSVSHKKWVRPNPANDPADALYPDIPVYTTIQDIIHGTDPQLEKLKALIKKGSG
jgi:hypothetical protein